MRSNVEVARLMGVPGSKQRHLNADDFETEEPQSPCSPEQVSPGSPWTVGSVPALVPAAQSLLRPVSLPRA